MHRLSALLFCLILVFSLGVGAVAHAAEGVTCVAVTAGSALDHSNGDADQVPADADKGYPHHHAGCHGHNFGVPVATIPVAPTREGQVMLLAWRNETKAPVLTDPALRPPQA